jgi:transcriptional regulator with XRE-family HTH domain
MISPKKGRCRMSINLRIKQIRKTLNLSQAKFAKEISISNGYIAGIELENRKVNDRIVKLICAMYGVNET